MKDFVIYHVPSLQKVGCTRNFSKRCRERYPDRQVNILEIVPAKCGAKYAGDVEWAYAALFGYKRRGHYLNTWDFKLTKDQRSIFGRLSPMLFTTADNRARQAARWKGPKGVGAPGMDGKTKKRIAAKGAKANGQSPNNFFRRAQTCPRCGTTGSNGASMRRWHFDNCRHV